MHQDMKIIIPGKPIPKARARHSSRGKYVVTYDPQDKDKQRVRKIMSAQLAEYFALTEKSISSHLFKICSSKVFSVQFLFFLPINQSDSVVVRNKKLWGMTRASTKPDYDNLEKFYLDCANGILWDDDSTVVQAKALKLYSEEPRVEIVINAVQDINVSKNVESVITSFSPSEFRVLQDYASKISQIAQPNIENLDDNILQDWIVSTACLLSDFALTYASKLNKIAKIGDVKNEVKKFEDYKRALEA